MPIKKRFGTTWAKVGLLSEVVGLLRGLLWLVRLVLDVIGEAEEAEKLMQYVPQVLGAWWFAPLFIAIGIILIWADNRSYRNRQKPKSDAEILRTQEVRRQIETLNAAEMEIVDFLRIHVNVLPAQVVTHLRGKGFDEADKTFNNLRGHTTLITTIDGMSGSVGINPAMKELVEEILAERPAPEKQPSSPLASWTLALLVISGIVLAVIGVHALTLRIRGGERNHPKQEAVASVGTASQGATSKSTEVAIEPPPPLPATKPINKRNKSATVPPSATATPPAQPARPPTIGLMVGGSVINSSVCDIAVPAGSDAMRVGKNVENSDIARLSVGGVIQGGEGNPCAELEAQWAKWPFDGKHPQMAEFFTSHLPEFSNLTGTDRFFLYQLIKRQGNAPTKSFLDDTGNEYRTEFPKMRGSPEMVSMKRLEDSGFLEKGWPTEKEIRLAEPYFSKYRNMDVP